MSAGEANGFPLVLEQVGHVPRGMPWSGETSEAEPFPIKGFPIFERLIEDIGMSRGTKVAGTVDAELVTELGPPFSKTCRFFEKVTFFFGCPNFGCGPVNQTGTLKLFPVVMGKDDSFDLFDSKSFELGQEFPGSPVDDQTGVPTPDQIGVAGVFVNEQEGQTVGVDRFDLFPPANGGGKKKKGCPGCSNEAAQLYFFVTHTGEDHAMFPSRWMTRT